MLKGMIINMKKKLLAILLATVIIAGTITLPVMAAESPAVNESEWSNSYLAVYPSYEVIEDVYSAIEEGLVPQSLQSRYDEHLTRVEFCALAVALYEKCTGSEIPERKAFDDTDDVNVEKAAAIGVVNGVGNNKFDPEGVFSQEQAATILARLAAAIGKPLVKETTDFDNQAISPWALDSVRQVLAEGIMYVESAFLPKTYFDRQAGIVSILRLYEYHLGHSIRTYTIEMLTVGAGTEYELYGKLTIPSGATADNPCPAVVLVQGSGSSDMDETIFTNKPFLDIADYLSSNGIAVIRYNKRTFSYGQKMLDELGGSLSVKEETIEDAILATEILKNDPRIDPEKVFIIGHSLGGMLAPRIHAEGGDYAGLILLAGSPRFLLDISKDQNMAYIEALPDGDEKDALLAEMESWDAQIDALVSLSDDDAKNVLVEAGASAYYFKELYEHPVAEYIKNISEPFLVLQGSADFQVSPDKDFALYQELLGDRQNATLKLYEGLSHLFMTSTTGTIEEYYNPGHVDIQVLKDIVEWIGDN